MNISDFIDEIILSDITKIPAVIDCALYEFEAVSDTKAFKKSTIDKVKAITEEKFTEFGDKIGACIAQCKSKLNNCAELGGGSAYVNRVTSFLDVLNQISRILKEVAEERDLKRAEAEAVAAASEQNRAVANELNAKINEMRSDVNKAVDKAVKEAETAIDTKIFSLLINTVAILGIFVAIAFTGFGVTAMFSNIDISAMSGDRASFVHGVFVVCLMALLSYNLLLLLIYFVFKLSRPLLPLVDKNKAAEGNKNSVEVSSSLESEKTFKQTVNLLPFYIVDFALLIITASLFIYSIRLTPKISVSDEADQVVQQSDDASADADDRNTEDITDGIVDVTSVSGEDKEE